MGGWLLPPSLPASMARTTELSLGRSQACDVVIGYRTVSTRHATLSYSRGEFFYQDNRSSNGSLLYLRAPLELPPNKVVRLRMGRSVLSLRARRNMQLRCEEEDGRAEQSSWQEEQVSAVADGGPWGVGGVAVRCLVAQPWTPSGGSPRWHDEDPPPPRPPAAAAARAEEAEATGPSRASRRSGPAPAPAEEEEGTRWPR